MRKKKCYWFHPHWRFRINSYSPSGGDLLPVVERDWYDLVYQIFNQPGMENLQSWQGRYPRQRYVWWLHSTNTYMNVFQILQSASKSSRYSWPQLESYRPVSCKNEKSRFVTWMWAMKSFLRQCAEWLFSLKNMPAHDFWYQPRERLDLHPTTL